MGNSQSDQFSFFIKKDPVGIRIYEIFKRQHPGISLTGEELIVLTATSPDHAHRLPEWAHVWAHSTHPGAIDLIKGIIESDLHVDDIVDDVVSILKRMND
jgi:hypothetical protein